MLSIEQASDKFVAGFARFERAGAHDRGAWFLPIRKAAWARFCELGFPTTRDEEWRFTNVAPIARKYFEPAGGERCGVTADRIETEVFADAGGPRLVFVNGRYAPDLSRPGRPTEGVKVGSLASALENEEPLVRAHLARYAAYQEQAFTALNTAWLEDGALVHVPKGRIVTAPIHLVFVSTAGEQALVSHPRNLIVVGEDAQATIIESHLGLEGVYFTNAVTELVVGQSAVVDHYKIERETAEAYHLATLQLHQCRNSNISSHIISLGGALVRHDINAVLDGEGSDCTLRGLYLVEGSGQVDNHLRVEHVRPHCTSREYFKGVLDGRGRGVFGGRIVVHKGACKTDAKQTNKTLLLSREARADSKPQLEIFADDVKCTHGATIGQIDTEAVFYLRSRGIGEAAARSLLACAFAGESLSSIRPGLLRAHLEQLVLARLGPGRLREGVCS